MLRTGKILTLRDGREFVIVTSTVYNNKIYIYIVNLDDANDTKVCLYENNELTEITDSELLDEVEAILIDDLANEKN